MPNNHEIRFVTKAKIDALSHQAMESRKNGALATRESAEAYEVLCNFIKNNYGNDEINEELFTKVERIVTFIETGLDLSADVNTDLLRLLKIIRS